MNDGVMSLVDVVSAHALSDPERRAFVFLSADCVEEASLTFGELDRRARATAARIAEVAQAGDRVLLAFPPGLDFVVAFLGCLYAGTIAVSTVMPRKNKLRDATLAIVEDSAPVLGLSSREHVESMVSIFGTAEQGRAFPWMDIDIARPLPDEDNAVLACERPSPDMLAFLQYTSGSTSLPKGVMVSHHNLLSNLRMITAAYGLGPESTRVGWVPLHHDMGLVFNVLQACYSRALCVLMSPMSFLKRPACWLRAIHRYQAELALGTNSSYQLCVDTIAGPQLAELDLSCWKLAITGAEPVRAETLDAFTRKFSAHGFDSKAFHPGYGMAEATLVIAGGRFMSEPVVREADAAALRQHTIVPAQPGSAGQPIVGCGLAMPGETIAIVEPDTHTEHGVNRVGEIWVQGPHVATGYWNKADATHATFRATLPNRDGVWLRTGDYGFLSESGELHITGRLKDMIIVRGENIYPQDIELTAERAVPVLRKDFGAAFSIEGGNAERIVVVYEVQRTRMRSIDPERVCGDVKQAVLREHGLALHECVLVQPGSIPKTTSGKIRRQKTRELWQHGMLGRLDT